MSTEELMLVYFSLIHVTALGQIIFIVLWATMPWRRSWIGRALMTKSLGLAAVLTVQIWFIHQPLGSMELRVKIAIALFILLCVGVWFQVFALAHEMYRKKKKKNPRSQ